MMPTSAHCSSRLAATDHGNQAVPRPSGSWRSAGSDNGFLSRAAPKKLQETCDSIGPKEIDRVFRKCRAGRLPPRAAAACRRSFSRLLEDWSLWIWQIEVSLTQIFELPLRGRELFDHPRQP